MIALMDSLAIERVVLRDLDRRHGRHLAGRERARAHREAVLFCTSAHMPPASAWRERAAVVLEAGTPEVVADSVVERWLTPDYAAGRADVRARPAGDARRHRCGRLRRVLRRDRAHGPARQLPRIAAPTLVISGSDDPATPLEHQRLIADAIPGARHEVVGPAAHMAAVQQPAAVNRLILEHL